MKFQPDFASQRSIQSSGPGWVQVAGQRHTRSLTVGPATEPTVWPCSGWDDLGAELFSQLAAYRPELVLFGSGERLRFPPPEWLLPLMQERIGFETMDRAAACRTYNVLVSEGRQVLLALLLEPTPKNQSPQSPIG